MNKELIVDFETCSTEQRTIILSMSFLCADPAKEWSFMDLVDEALTFRVDIVEQNLSGRISDKSTLKWWSEQDKILQ